MLVDMEMYVLQPGLSRCGARADELQIRITQSFAESNDEDDVAPTYLIAKLALIKPPQAAGELQVRNSFFIHKSAPVRTVRLERKHAAHPSVDTLAPLCSKNSLHAM